MCYCRHKMMHMDRACSAPLDICMTLNTTTESLIKHHHARRVEAPEGLDLLQIAYENQLVQSGENVSMKIAVWGAGSALVPARQRDASP